MSDRYAFGPIAMPPIDPATIHAEHKVGIAYSGGGDRVVIELGIVQAFIQMGIIPHYIAGTSAGSFAGALHALDPHTTSLIPLAVKAAQDGVPLLHPTPWRVFVRLLPAALAYLLRGPRALRLQSITDTRRLRKLLEKRLPVKTLGELQLPLSISSTNALTGQEVWFEQPSTKLVPALLASSAVPGLFPPVNIDGQLYIDGGTSDNLPLFHLAQKGCSLIFACDVGYAGEANSPPRNLLDTLLLAESIGQYAGVLNQEALLAARFPEVRVVSVRPKVALSTLPSSFKVSDVPTYVAQAAEETRGILQASGLLTPPR